MSQDVHEGTAGPPQKLIPSSWACSWSQTPVFSAGCTVWDVPTKRRVKNTFQIDLSLFSMLVTLWVSPVPTLEGGPGSGSLRRHLRLPSSLRWDNPTPPKDTSQKKSQTACSGTKIPQEFTMKSHTQTWDRAVSPVWPWHRRCLPYTLHPTTVPLETPGKPFPGQTMHSLDGNAQKYFLSLAQGFLQSHTRSRVVVSSPYFGGLHPLPAPRQQHQSKMGCRTVLDNV